MRSPHRSRARGWLCVLLATLALVALAVSPASAAGDDKYGTVAVIDAATGTENIVNGEPQVCDFYFEFDLNETSDVVGWVVKTWNSTPLSGTTVLSGNGGPTDANGKLRQPDSGSLSLPDGRYNVVWDDETPVDGSNGHQSFTVSCESARPTPTPTPTGVVLPASGSPRSTPTGGVEAAVGTPKTTLPPTDTATATSGGSSAVWLIAAAMGLFGFVLLSFAPRHVAERVRIHRRRS
jgi:hypothetical protein